MPSQFQTKTKHVGLSRDPWRPVPSSARGCVPAFYSTRSWKRGLGKWVLFPPQGGREGAGAQPED